jgi:hypothetical protein
MSAAVVVDQDVKAAIEQFQLRKQFRAPEVPEVISEMAQQKQYYIYNVGPYDWAVSHGTTGSFTIPACEKDKAHSKPLIIDGIVFETYIIAENTLASYQWDGKKMALETLGVGPRRSPVQSLVPWGCFLAEGKEPNAKEIKAANEALDRKASELVAEANIAFQQNPGAAWQTITQKHRDAAARMKLSPSEYKWLGEYTPGKEVQCGACFVTIPNAKATICHNCKSALNGIDGGLKPIKVS